jgi:hypothetical protein
MGYCERRRAEIALAIRAYKAMHPFTLLIDSDNGFGRWRAGAV